MSAQFFTQINWLVDNQCKVSSYNITDYSEMYEKPVFTQAA